MPRIFNEERNHYFVTVRDGLLSSYDYRSGVYGSFSQLSEAKRYAQCLEDGLNYVHILDASGKVICSYNKQGKQVIEEDVRSLVFYP